MILVELVVRLFRKPEQPTPPPRLVERHERQAHDLEEAVQDQRATIQKLREEADGIRRARVAERFEAQVRVRQGQEK